MKRCVVALLGLLWALPATAQQNQASASLTINTYVEAACEVVSTENLLFGLYDPVGVNSTLPSRASGSISVRCTNGTTNVKVTLGEGMHPEGASSCAFPRRQMISSSGQNLPYMIFQDATENLTWGCSPDTSRALPAFETLTPVVIPTFGLIPAAQDVSVGNYQDIIEVSVTF